MASADVFKDIHANSINLDSNKSSTGISGANLGIMEMGAGDPTISFGVGNAHKAIMGIDNSQGDRFKINVQSGLTGLANSSSFCIDSDSNVAIGSSTGTVTDARLAVISTSAFFLPPVMTASQMDAISTPISGAMVFNTTSGAICVYSGEAGTASTWRAMDFT